MATEKFCLRWNDFENNISNAFKELRDDKDFFDITIACDDEQIQAHKVILSACSPFFRNVLRRNPHQHPLLYLKGVRYVDLQSVMNFMYHGEVNVAQEELNAFLAVAEDLKVKGLTQNNTSDNVEKGGHFDQSHKHIKSATRPPPPDKEFPKRPRPPITTPSSTVYSAPSHSDYEDIQEVVPVKTEPRDTHPVQPAMHQSSPIVPVSEDVFNPQPSHALTTTEDQLVYQEENYEDYSQQYEMGQEYEGAVGDGVNKGSVEDMLTQTINEEGKTVWKCEICGKDFPFKSGGKRHVETMHFETPGFECEVCGKILKNKNSYQNHISIIHGIKRRSGLNFVN